MGLIRRLVNVFRSERLSRELDRELEFHVAERADELEALGMSASAARREARRRLGNYVLQKERTREIDVLNWLDTVRADVRYGLRALRASPGFSVVAVVSLAVGIGANTAIFGLIDAVVLKPLPVPAPEELVQLTMEEGALTFTNPLWEAIRDRQTVFGGIAAYSEPQFNLAEGGESRPVRGSYVSGDYFRMLGVQPVVGRLLGAEDDYRGCAPVAVLGHGFWKSEYGGARNVAGLTVPLNGEAFEVIGVVEPSFTGVTVGRSIDVWVPVCAEAVIAGPRNGLDMRSRWYLQVLARKAADLPLEAANAHLATIAPAVYEATVPERYDAAEQENYRKGTLAAVPAAAGQSLMREQYGKALIVLLALVAVVLLIACANVANLLLARATVRERELALRAAIGAARGRIIRQLLTESALLALLSAVLGTAIAWWGSRALMAMLATSRGGVALRLPLDLRILGFTLLVAVTAALLFGLAPAWRGGRADPQSTLRAGGRGVVHGQSRLSAGKLLVSAQVALSLALVVAAGLLINTFRTLSTAPIGFDRAGVLLVSVDLPDELDTLERQRSVYGDLLARLRALRGAESVSLAQITPVGNARWNDEIVVEGFTPAMPQEGLSLVNEVSDGYFATLGTRVLAGREFSTGDRAGAPRAAVVNDAFARHFFGTPGVLGRSFRIGRDEAARYEIVGVVETAKYQSLREEPQPTVYLSWAQAEERAFGLSFLVRTRDDGAALRPAIRAAARAAEPTMSLRFTGLSQQLADSLTRERLLATLSGFFGGMALLLAMIGLYGVMAYGVARRRSEIGLRMALGSARGRVMWMVLGEAGALVGAGLVLGTGLAYAGTRLVASFLYGLESTDAPTWIGAAVLLAAIALFASAVPAWRASQVEPMTALRVE